MFIKVILSMLLALSMCLAAGCSEEGQEDTDTTVSVDALMGDYASVYESYTAEPVDVSVTLTVDMGYSIENRFSLTQSASGYTLTDLTAEKTVTYEVSQTEHVYKTAGYLPPYEIAYPDEAGGYSSRISGDIALEMLLSGSNLFDGYDSGSVTLDGECLFSVTADTEISSYSYEFAVNVADGDAQFPAKIKYLIEVNK